MASVMELIADLERVVLRAADSSAERADKMALRTELARSLSGILEGADLDAEMSHAAARALKDVHGAGTEFVELAQRLARASWKGGHPEGARLFASVTDVLCNRRHEPQRFGTLTYVRHGEKILLPVDPSVDEDERAELGLPALSDLRAEIALHNRRLAERHAVEPGLPPEATLRRVWRDDDPATLVARQAADGPVWRDGDELVFAWQGDAHDVSVSGGLQIPMWQLEASDVWTLRVRIRDLDRGVISHAFVGTKPGDATPSYLGGDGCWRGPEAPPVPPLNRPLAGEVRELNLPGPGEGDQRAITAYLPPGHDPALAYAVVYLADGNMTRSLAEVTDAAITRGTIPPVVLVGVASGTQPGEDMRNDEYIVGRHPDRFEAHRSFFVGDVSAWAESQLGAALERERRVVFGVSSGAAFAVTMGLRHPDRFGKVVAFSLGVFPVEPSRWPPGRVPAHYLAAGTLEEGFRRSTANWARSVTDAGGDCVHVETVSGHDYRMWELQFALALEWALAGPAGPNS